MSGAVVKLKTIDKLENFPWDNNYKNDNKIKNINSKVIYETIINESPDAIISTDNNGNITFFSKGAEYMFGYKAKEVIGKKVEHFYFKGLEESKKVMSLLEKNRRISNHESIFLAKDKSTIPVSISISYLKDDKGRILGTLGIGKDISIRKQSERALLESEGRFRSIVENSHNGIGILDEKFRITYINNKIIQILGYEQKEIIGTDFRKFLEKDSKKLVEERYKKRQKGEKVPDNYEFQIVRKNGEIRDVEIKTIVMRNNKGKIRTIAQIMDITEQKIAKFEIESLAKFPGESPNPVFRISRKGDLIYSNDASKKLIKIWNKKQNSNFDSQLLKKSLSSLKKNKVLKTEIPIDNKIFAFTIAPIKSYNYVNIYGLDITNRKKALKKVRESEELYKTLVRTSPVAVTLSDLEGKITYVSPQTLKLHGFQDSKEIIGKNAFNFIAVEDQERALNNSKKTLVGNIIRNEEYKMLKKDGTKFIGELSASLIKDANGNPKAFIATTNDITERKFYENELIKLKDYNNEILQSVKSGIVATDENLNVLTWNDYMEESYGLRKEKIINKNLLKVLPQLRKEKFDNIIKNVKKTGKIYREYMIFHKTKRGCRYYNITIAPRIDLEKKVVGFLMNWDDVTELAKTGAKLTTIHQVSKEMMLSKEENEILKIGLDAIENILKFHNCSIILKKEDKNELFVKSHRGYSNNLDKVRFNIKDNKGIIVQTFNKNKVHNVQNVKKEPNYQNFDPKIKSEIAIPMKIREKTIGVINVESDKLMAFDESDEKILTTLSSSISTALNNIKLYEQTIKKANSLASLNNIGKAISSKLDLDEVFQTFYTQMGNVLETKNLYIALYDNQKNQLQFELEVEDNKLKTKRKRKFNTGLSEHVIRNGKPLLIKNNFIKECKKLGINPHGRISKTWLGVPLIIKEKAIGVITIQSYERENSFDDEQLDVISTVADQLAIAIENSRLYKNLEEHHKQLEGAYDELKEMDKIKSEFLAVTSHEFGTPITILKGNVNMFLDGTLGDLPEIQHKRMSSINNSVQRLEKMRNQTILLSKLDSKRVKLNHDNVFLNELIEELVNEMEIVANQNKQKIITNLKDIQLVCDKDTIKGVFENLISNAVKYSGDNAKISINMKKMKNGGVHVIVADNGTGISKKHLKNLFERFYIAHDYLNHKQGTGLGLAIVKEIVEAHGGEVYCESEPNKGSKFHVILPKKPTSVKTNCKKDVKEDIDDLINNNEKRIVESIDSGIVITNLDLKILVWNDYMVEHYGASKNVIGKNIFKCFPKMKSDGFNELFNKVIDGKSSKEYMVMHETRNGLRFFNIYLTPRFNDNNNITGILMKWDDVTDLAGLGQRLSVLYDLSHKMVLCKDINEIINMSLDALKDTLKFKKCSIILKDNETSFKQAVKNKKLKMIKIGFKEISDSSLISLETGEAVINNQQKEKTKSEISVPIIIKNEIIGVINIKSQKSNEFNESDKKLLSILSSEVSTSMDNINMYHEVEKKNIELQKAYDELKVLDNMKSEFIAISAHEIGTPLTIIKGNVEMLMDGNFGKVNEIQKKRFRVINNNVERINTLSKDSLILTKIDSKNLKLIKRKSSISKLTYDIVEEMKPLAFQKNQNIKFDLKDEIKASFDRTTITQVINNLLSNAIKYTKNKGRIHVALENGNKDIHLLVKDNGIGISKKEHEKIFERFYMVENHLHHKDGSGLGLAIVKEIIELHNGKVWVESKKNKGTTFHFTIPAK